jgi:hypothetical protein
LTDKLLKPFSAHNINMEVFFQDVAEKVKQKEKVIEENVEKREQEIEQKRIR